MQIIAVDDEKIALEGLVRAVKKVVPDAEVHDFRKAADAVEHVREHSCDVAFLDIEMFGMNGINLAQKLRMIAPRINIIFITGYSEYTQNAFALHASGYLLKPVTPDKIEEELNNLRFGVEPKSEKRLNVCAFGKFEVYAEGRPLNFKYSKTKELLAVLVDQNGAFCSNREIECLLWEDGNHTSYLKNVKSDLLSTLKKHGCSDVILRERGRIAIIPDKISCDYYDWLNEKEKSGKSYRGEYMSQYSWAEVTHGMLEDV